MNAERDQCNKDLNIRPTRLRPECRSLGNSSPRRSVMSGKGAPCANPQADHKAPFHVRTAGSRRPNLSKRASVSRKHCERRAEYLKRAALRVMWKRHTAPEEQPKGIWPEGTDGSEHKIKQAHVGQGDSSHTARPDDHHPASAITGARCRALTTHGRAGREPPCDLASPVTAGSASGPLQSTAGRRRFAKRAQDAGSSKPMRAPSPPRGQLRSRDVFRMPQVDFQRLLAYAAQRERPLGLPPTRMLSLNAERGAVEGTPCSLYREPSCPARYRTGYHTVACRIACFPLRSPE